MLRKIIFIGFASILIIGLIGCGQPTAKKVKGSYISDLNSLSDKEQIKALRRHTIKYTRYSSKYTGNKKTFIVKVGGYAYIKYINNPSEKVQLWAVNQSASALAYIKNPTEKVQLEAVKKGGSSLSYVKKSSEKVQLEAVRHSANALKYINKPSEKVQIEAVKRYASALAYIKNPSKKVQLEAVIHNGTSINHIKEPSEKIQIEAVKENGYAINFIKNPTEKTKLAALKQHGQNIKYINNPSKELKLIAMTTYPNYLMTLKDPELYLQLKYFKIKDKNKLAMIEYKEADKYNTLKEYKKALYWYRLSSKNGLDSATFMLGDYYSYGYGVKKDYLIAAKYYESVANKEWAIVGAKYNACYMYTKAKSYNKALECYKQERSSESINAIGIMYKYGNGVKMDKIKAYHTYLKAAKMGNEHSQVNLDILCKESPWACK
jgi:TPR repeat protein